MKNIPNISLIIFSILCVFASCKSDNNGHQKKYFVKVENTKFTFGGKPYYFSGTNMWYGAYLGADTTYGNRERLLRELDRLQSIGITNVRILAASEQSDYSLPINPPFQYKNGTYNEKLLQGLDFLLVEMGKRNMYAILFLNNYWDWSGGMGQYVSWVENTKVCDPSRDSTLTWIDYLAYTSPFYNNDKAQKIFRDYIKMIVNRENIYSKVAYKDDPTIMAWELANEPRPNPNDTATNLPVFYKWIDSTSQYIHSLDQNHLVTTGSEGSKGSLNSLQIAAKAHESKYIDYMVFHLWPKNWGWFKADSSETIKETEIQSKNYIAEHIQIARKLNKPVVLEEFGLGRDLEKNEINSPVTNRDRFYKFILKIVNDSINAGSPMAGFNFWAWGGEGRAQHPDGKWRIGDQVYVGDPYGEAQGLNSIFDTDSSTIQLIKTLESNKF